MSGDDREPTAIVVVHGIGEQMPMDTVRSFVTTLFGAGSLNPNPPAVRNRVDRHSQFLDLRRLTLDRGQGHGRVDFYELYWAPTLGSGTVGSVLAWSTKMLKLRAHGSQLRQALWTVRIAALLLVAVLAAFTWFALSRGWWAALAPLVPLLGLALFLPKAALRHILTEVLADASRWFAPAPADLAERDRVRRQGLELLEGLHRPPDHGRPYERIVVVGHSLGSVVAYDLLRMLYDRMRWPADADRDPEQTSQTQPAAWHFEAERSKLTDDADVRRYQHFQHQLHLEQRAAGVPWLISDFITIGSPLTHARDLWTSSVTTLDQRIAESELPACPPVGVLQDRDADRARSGRPIPINAASHPVGFYRVRDRDPLVAHEASVFAQTRWTNLFFPMRWWLGGDPVGGPLAPVFGSGILDIPVRVSAPAAARRRVLAIPVAAHTWYWQRHRKTERADVGTEPGHPPDAVETLAEVIDLSWRSPRDRYPVPDESSSVPQASSSTATADAATRPAAVDQ